MFEQVFLGGLGAYDLFGDSLNVSFVIGFKTWLNVIVHYGLGASAMLWAKTVSWRFHSVPRYHDLGGRSEENASLATHGAYVLVRVGRGDGGK
jgi:hypothetical protein